MKNEEKKKVVKRNMKYVKQVFGYILEKKMLIFWWIVTAVLVSVTGVVTPFINAKILSAVTEYIPEEVVFFLLISLFINLFEAIVSYFSSLFTEKLENEIVLNLNKDFAKLMYELEVKNFDKEGTGMFSSRITGEPRSIAFKIYNLRHRITELLSSAGVFVFLFVISWEITIFIVIFALLDLYFDMKRTKIWKKYREETNLLYESNFSSFHEFIRGVRDIKVLNISDYVLNKIYENEKIIFEKDLDHMKKTRFLSNFSHIFNSLATFIIFIFAIYLISLDRLSASNLIIIYMYLSRAFGFFGQISTLYEDVTQLNVSIDRLCELTEGDKYPKEIFGDVDVEVLNGNIEFKNVTFAYDKKKVLKNIDLNIKANTTVGFVGESGQGKTTIFNLISKLYSTKDNTVFIDGYDINTLTEKSIRNNMSIITQNPYIFNISIKENLKMVNPSLTDKEIKEIIKKCALDKFVEGLDKKYDTKVGEGGVTLSGGQRQRLALARALAKNSNIILMDEATSALDNKTQNQIQSTVKKIGENKTVLIIAHRLSTIINCDKIFVVDDGKIINSGTHKYLSENCEFYKNLYESEKF